MTDAYGSFEKMDGKLKLVQQAEIPNIAYARIKNYLE